MALLLSLDQAPGLSAQESERVGSPFDGIREIGYALSASELTEVLARG